MAKINFEGWDDPKFAKRAGKKALKLADAVCDIINKQKIPCTVAAGALITALDSIIRCAPNEDTREYLHDFVVGNMLTNIAGLSHDAVQSLINWVGDSETPPPSAVQH